MSGYQTIHYLSRYLKKTSMKKYGVLNYSFASAQGTVQIEKKYDEITEDSIQTPVTDEYFGLLKDYNVIEIMI
jgi:UDP-galactopyranose mutase